MTSIRYAGLAGLFAFVFAGCVDTDPIMGVINDLGIIDLGSEVDDVGPLDTGPTDDTGETDAGKMDVDPGNELGERDTSDVGADTGGVICPAPGGPSTPDSRMSFFVTSVPNMGANYGGLDGADERCRCLADAVGMGQRAWRAYVSTAPIDGVPGNLVDARDRIGGGPWFNYDGTLIANDLESLHASPPDRLLLIDEYGDAVSAGEQEILTGSNSLGNALRSVPGMAGTLAPTCNNWTTASATVTAFVGRADWNDPAQAMGSWNADHAIGCNTTGRLYCFAMDTGTPAEILVSPTTLNVLEGDSGTVDVVLNVAPTANVTVMINASNTSIDIAPAGLTFTPSNWNTPQPVQVTGAQDADDMDETANVTISAAGYPDATVSVTVTDDEAQAIRATPATLRIDEGAGGLVGVNLTQMPTGNITVSVTSANPSVATVSPPTLTFTPQNFAMAQNVTVSGVDDANALDDTVVITFSAGGLSDVTVSVTVTDDDVLSIVPSVTIVNAFEGSTSPFDVRLSAQPAQDVVIAVGSSNTNSVSAMPLMMMFTPANWNVPQIVTVMALEDADANDDSATLSLTASGLATVNVTVNVTDNDRQSIFSSAAQVTVLEGATATFMVNLALAPTGSLTVGVASSNPAGATVMPTMLTFDAGNFSTPQLVTITGVQDVDSSDAMANITLSGAGVPDVVVAVTVTDDDMQSIFAMPAMVTLNEGGQATIDVSLATPPAGNLLVTIVSSDGGALTVNPASLTFDGTNFDQPQQVLLGTVEDLDNSDELVTVTLSAPGARSAIVAATITDDDVQAIITTERNLLVNEGRAGTVGVRLAARPTTDVTVGVTSSSPAVATVAPASMTFTSANWDVPQNILVQGVNDLNLIDGNATITLTATGLANATIDVTVVDDDRQAIVASVASIGVLEGATATVDLALAFAPQADVVVTLASSDPAAASVTPATLTFTVANYATPQTVTIAGANDADTQPASAQLIASSAGVTSLVVPITVTDDDAQAIFASATTLDVPEGGNRTFAVRLVAQPAQTVAIMVTSSNIGAATVAPATLTFTTANFAAPQTVTVTGVDDADTTDGASTLSLMGTGLDTLMIAVTVRDDDRQAILSSAATLSITEGGSATTNLTLAAQPTTNVVVNAVSSAPNAASVAPASVTFTPQNWNQAQTLTVTARQDDDTANGAALIGFSAAGVDDVIVPVTITDDDQQAIVANPAAVNVTEGRTGPLSVRLAFVPLGDVTVSLTSSNPAAVTVTPASLVFNGSNYASPQTVWVQGLHDGDLLQGSATITAAATGLANVQIPVTVEDDDAQAIVTNVDSVSVVEGQMGQVGVSLAFAPAANVTVSVVSSNPAVATIAPDALTFTPANYQTPQTVVVTAAQDADADPGSATMTLSVAGLANRVVGIAVTDDDAQAIFANATSVAIAEGGTGGFDVRLVTAPAQNVTVTVASANGAALMATPAGLTFTPANFATTQRVTLTAANDDNVADETIVVTLSTPGLGDVSVAVQVRDDDQQSLVVTPAALTVAEGASAWFGVRLAFAPAANVVVAVASSDPGSASANPATLTFTPTNYATVQQVTITGVQDPDVLNDSANITLTAPNVAPQIASVTVTDDDTQALIVDNTALTLNEGASATVNVRLAFAPAASVVATAVSGAPALVGVSPGSVTFTTENYAAPQAVVITALQDLDTVDGTTMVALSAIGLPNINVAVAVTDDDSQALVATAASVAVVEGGTTMFGVNLAFAPANPITVAVVSSNPSVATVAPPTLTFTPANYAQAQNITVSGVDDVDLVAGNAQVLLSSAGLPNLSVAVAVTDDDTQAIFASANAVALTEGGAAPVGVNLVFAPTANVTVTVLSADTGAVGASPATLTFTPANFATAQIVTLLGAEDADANNESVIVTLASAGLADVPLTVGVTDNDALSIVVDAQAVAVAEGGNRTIAVALGAQPATDVTVAAVASNGSVAIAPAMLTFTAANFATPQVLTISGVQDVDLANETAVLALVAAGLPTANVMITVTDDDAQAIVAGANNITIGEGIEGWIPVNLAFQPAANVTVTVVSSNPNELAVTPATLTFTPANYAAPQQLTIVGVQDDDLTDESPTITLSAAGVPNATINLTVDDDDIQSIVTAAGNANVVEGATSVLAVNLAFRPTADVTVAAVSSNTGAFTVAPATLTFTAANWNVPQTLTLTGVDDVDLVNASASLTLSSAGLANRVVAVTVADDDAQQIFASTPAITIAEGGSGTFDVSLVFAPTANLVVTVASADAGAASVAPTTLTFTPTNFATAQTVTVNGLQDTDIVNDSTAIILMAAGLGDVSVAVAINDDDTQGLVVAPASLTVAEGTTAMVAVSLAFQPAGNTAVAVTSSDPGAAAVTPAALTFTPNNFATPQMVVVSGTQDLDIAGDSANITFSTAGVPNAVTAVTVNDDDTQALIVGAQTLTVAEGGVASIGVNLAFRPNDVVAIAIVSSNAAAATVTPATLTFTPDNYAMPQAVQIRGAQDLDVTNDVATVTFSGGGAVAVPLNVSVTDDDTQAIVASAATLNVIEGGNATFGVNLAFQPTNDITVTVASSDPGAAAIAPATLTFTSANYAIIQQVTVSGIDDVDLVNDAANAILSAGGLTNVTVALTVTDDDAQAIFSSATALTVAEGQTVTFDVNLVFAPTNDVLIAVASSAPNAATVTPQTLTFTPASFATPQRVTVTAAQDADAANGAANVTLTSVGLANVVIGTTIIDDDTQAISVDAAALTVLEGGVATLAVRLASQPANDVVVTAVSSNTGAATIAPGNLTFTPANYNVAQLVSITGVQDLDLANGATNIALSAVGLANTVVAVTVNDDDTQAIVAGTAALAMVEGAEDWIGVSLAFQPATDVTVNVLSDAQGAVTVSPATLTFTPGNYAAPQQLTVVGVQDDDLAPGASNIVLSSAGLANTVVAITVADDDQQAIVPSTTQINSLEGATSNLGLRLAFRPGNIVRVSVTSSDNASATVAPALVTFTPDNYAQQQTVTITGVDDVDLTNDAATLTLSSGGLPNVVVAVTITDDDAQSIFATDTALTIGEGGTSIVGVNLAFAPTNNVVVTLASDDPAIATVTPTTLTFTPGNFGTPQPITISSLQDADVTQDMTQIRLQSAGLPNIAIALTITDDDIQAIVPTVPALTVVEGATGMIGVALAFQPAANVLVAVGSSDPASATVSPATLTFTPANYNTPQPVTVGGVQDVDVIDDSSTITLSTPGLPAVGVPVSVTDDDTQQIIISNATFTIGEGNTAQLGVNLAFQPQANVVVTLTSSDPAASVVAPTQVTFTSENYAVAQVVTITAPHDVNVTNGAATVTLAAPGLNNALVNITITDDDTQAIVAAAANVAVVEGANATLGVTLAFQPAANIVVTVASSNVQGATAAPATLTFSPTNYNVTQNVTIGGVDDINVTNETSNVTLTAAGLQTITVPVIVTDDDAQSIFASTNAITVAEGGAATVGVNLVFAPANNVTVTVGSSDPASATATPATLTFTPANFATPQNVTLVGVQDFDANDDAATVTLASAGLADVSIAVTVDDDDSQGIVPSAVQLTVAESTTSMLGVSLAAQPTGNVVVNLASSDTMSATVNPMALTFTPATWNVVQNVTIAGLTDLDAVDDTVTLALSSAGLANVTVTIIVDDDDIQGIVLATNAITINEGGTGTIGVALAFQPTNNVNVTVASSDPGATTFTPATLTFTPANYATAQPVTVSGVEDVDLANESTIITFSSAGLPNRQAMASVTDDDVQSIIVTATQVATDEGATVMFGVSLAFSPAQNVSVMMSSSDAAAAAVSPTTLFFTPATYAMVQQVTVTGVQDVDLLDEQVTLTVTSGGLPNVTIAVAVNDDDGQRIVASVPSLGVNEGATGMFGVNLAFMPTADVVVNVASSDEVSATAAPATLTFTPANFATPQNVTIAGPQDVDVTNDQATVTLTSIGLDNVAVDITVLDDDVQTILTSSATATLAEGGNTAFNVTLMFQPPANVTVNVASSDVVSATVQPAVLTFTRANYNTPQTVTVSGPQDIDLVDDSATVTLSSAGLTNVTVPVTVTDDDQQVILPEVTMLNVFEGANAQMSIRLMFQPAQNVVVGVVSSDPASATVAPGTLTFTAANFNMPQVITVTAPNDPDAANDTTNIVLSAMGVPNANVAVTVTDDELQQIFSDTALVNVNENANGMIGVRLSTPPLANVLVDATSSDPGALTPMPAQLTFTPANWDQPQMVTVTGVDDLDNRDEVGNITLSSPGLMSIVVAVNVFDDDLQSIQSSATMLTVIEGGTGTFTVRLEFPPPQNTVVTVVQPDPAIATAAPANLTFTNANFDQPQTVTVTGTEDINVANEVDIITLFSQGLADVVINLAVTENDMQGIVAAATMATVAEGATANVNVNLAFQPPGNVVVMVDSSDPAAATANPAMLTFSQFDWDQPQPVTIGGAQDVDLEDEQATVTLSSAGLPNITIAATVTDDDAQSIVASATTLNVNEGGTGMVGVNLAFQPSADVTVAVASSDEPSATIAPAALTFTPMNWNVAQQVTVTGIQDVDVTNDAATVTLTSAGLANVAIAVTVADDDLQGIIVSANAVTVAEGGTVTYDVTLAFSPAADVVVAVATDDAISATATPATLTFTSQNYNVPQQVTVGGPQDVDLVNDFANITLSAGGLPNIVTTVVVTDDDMQAIVSSAQMITVNEGGNGMFGVNLAFQPVGNIVVAINSSDPISATADPPQLFFNANDYNVPQMVTVGGPQDVDLVDDMATITLLSQGVADVTVAATVTDDDAQAIIVDLAQITILEGGTGVFNVNLTFQPTANVVVAIASGNQAIATVAPTTLTFTPMNFDTPQAITVTGTQDENLAQEMTPVTLTSQGLANRTVNVTVNDDDAQSIVVSTNAVTIGEGLGQAVNVSLRFQPPVDVTLMAVSDDAASATANPAMLTFTPANYATTQPVTIAGPQDPDITDDVANVTISGAGLANQVIAVTVTDDDTQSIVASVTQVMVTEGQNATFNVTLSQQPAFDVFVMVDSSDFAIANPGPAFMTFTAANYNMPQTVTVGGVDDVGLTNNNANVTLTAQGLTDVVIPVTVTDDDTQRLVTDVTMLTVPEGNGAVIGVNLAFQPTGNVIVNAASSDPVSATVMPAMLTFTPMNWDLIQDVNVTGEQDVDVTDDSAQVTISSAGLTPIGVAITVDDEDVQLIVTDVIQLNVTENQNDTVAVTLAFQPANNVQVTAASSDPGAVGVVPPSVTFTPQNYNVAQILTISGTDDADNTDETGTVTLTATGLQAVPIAVNVFDDDFQEIVLSADPISVGESGSVQLGVRLRFQPNANLMVGVSDPLPATVTRTPDSLTFTPQNFDQQQFITISGIDDIDTVNGDSMMTFFAANVPDQPLDVVIIDDDVQAILTNPAMLTVTEGEMGNIDVTLAFQPINNVTIEVSSADPMAATVTPTTLTFTQFDFDVPQAVTVTGVGDLDDINDMTSISLFSAGIANNNVAVTVTDDDVCPAPGGASNPSNDMSFFVTSVGNAMRGGNYTGLAGADMRCGCLAEAVGQGGKGWRAYLSTAPLFAVGGALVNARDRIGTGPWFNYSGTQIAADVNTLHATPPASALILDEYGNAPAAASAAVLTGSDATGNAQTEFPGAPGTDPPSCQNWTDQTQLGVGWTGSANWDALMNATWNSTIDVPCDSAGMATNNSSGRLYCFATETGQRIVVNANNLTTAEGGTTTLGVRLSEMPTGNITVAVASSDTNAGTVAPASLVFTTGNWNVVQNVTVSGAQDIDIVNDTFNVNLTSNGLTAVAVGVTVTDDDQQAILRSTPTVNLTEGNNGTVGVTLLFQPAANVSVQVTTSDIGAASVTPAALTFTPQNYNVAQNITVGAVQDNNLDDENVTLTLQSTGLANVTIAVTVDDDDIQSIVTNATNLTVFEGGMVGFTANLAFPPPGNVTVAVGSSDTGAATVAPATLNFSVTNWDSPQQVTITGIQDADTNNETVNVTLSSAGLANNVIAVGVNDDDVQSIIASQTTVAVNEGNAQQINITLSQQPAQNVTVSVMSNDANAASATPASLVFTPGNFDTPQAVTITGVQDADTTNENVQVTLSSAGLSNVLINVNVTDDDVQSIQATPLALNINEGGTGVIAVTLALAPAGNTNVAIASSDAGAASANPTVLTFTPANFATPQNVTITGEQDGDSNNEAVTMTLSSGGLPNVVANVTVTDDDVGGIVPSVTMLTVTEGATAVFSVTLGQAPGANTDVMIATSDMGAATVNPTTLTFTPANFNTPQNVTVTGVDDMDTNNEMVVLTLSATALANVVVNLTVGDDDGACPAPGGMSNPAATFSFFATSVGNGALAGNYGGLAGADARCQCLAAAVGSGARTWRAYLSTAPLPGLGGMLVHARDRIGTGPWFNYNGTMVAANVADLHATPPPNTEILDEYGAGIPRQEHDILTGTMPNGNAWEFHPAAGAGSFPPTCDNWTDDTGVAVAEPGHTDRETTGGDWNDAGHQQTCTQAGFIQTAGTGRLYCFAID